MNCRSSPASLPDNDDLLWEILLRLPPQPSSLPRASAVCRRWRRLATDPKFIARVRAHHRKPPLLGVFEHRDQNLVFTPVLDPPDRIHPLRFDLRTRSFPGAELLGCRHGRVLIMDKVRAEVVVCSPVDREQCRLPIPPGLKTFFLNGTVICAAGDQGHVHGGCHSSPFQIVLVFMGSSDGRPLARVYSSETGLWGDLISSEAPCPACWGANASTLVGNVLYWPLMFAKNDILEFDLERKALDVIKGPPDMNDRCNYQIMEAVDGAVGVAIISNHGIKMWQRKVHCQGVTKWLLWKTVQMCDILGIPTMTKTTGGLLHNLGYDEDNNIIFVYAEPSVYMVQLTTLQAKKVYETSYSNANQCHPFTSYYTSGTTITGGGAEMLHEG